MSDKTIALLTAGNAMATRLREIEFSRYSDDWFTAILNIKSSAELPYLLGVMEGRQENFAGRLEALIEKDPRSFVKSADASYAYGYLDACDKTFEVRDLARASILHYNELLQIARDLREVVLFPGGEIRATDALNRLAVLEHGHLTEAQQETSDGT